MLRQRLHRILMGAIGLGELYWPNKKGYTKEWRSQVLKGKARELRRTGQGVLVCGSWGIVFWLFFADFNWVGALGWALAGWFAFCRYFMPRESPR